MKVAFVAVGAIFTLIAGFGLLSLGRESSSFQSQNANGFDIGLIALGLVLIGGLALLIEGVKPGTIWGSRKAKQAPP